LTVKKRAVLIAGCLLVSLGAGVFYSLPYLALYRIMAAFETQDMAKLSELIDFDRLREHLKRFLTAKILNVPGEQPPAAGKDLRDSLVRRLVDRAVDDLVTPEGMAAFMKERMTAAAGDSGPPGAWSLLAAFLRNTEFSYTGPAEFTIVVPEGPEGTVRFIMRRHGLTWRLTAMEF
jgi:hypothetical protein